MNCKAIIARRKISQLLHFSVFVLLSSVTVASIPPPDFYIRIAVSKGQLSPVSGEGTLAASFGSGEGFPQEYYEERGCAIEDGDNPCNPVGGYSAFCPIYASTLARLGFWAPTTGYTSSSYEFVFSEDNLSIKYQSGSRILLGSMVRFFKEKSFDTPNGAQKGFVAGVAFGVDSTLERQGDNYFIENNIFDYSANNDWPIEWCGYTIVGDLINSDFSVWQVPPAVISNTVKLDIGNFNDIPDIELVDQVTSEKFIFRPLHVTTLNHVRYGSPCQVGVDPNCGVPELPPVPEKNQGGTCPSDQMQGNPINLGVANKYQSTTDFSGLGYFPLQLKRAYNSIGGVWQFFSTSSYDLSENLFKLVRTDGKVLSFNGLGGNSWGSDSDIKGTLVSFDDGSGNITGWRYTTLDDQVEDYDTQGRLTKISNRAGLAHIYSYDVSSITITDDFGRSLVLSQNVSGVITGFTDPDGNQYTYNYDNNGNLASVSYPNGGGTRTYHYEDSSFPNGLTGITDENGGRFATWSYDSVGRAINSEHNDGAENITIDYTYLDNSTDPRSTVTNALGKQTTYHFITLNGVRKVTQVEGHASSNCVAANKAYTYFTDGTVQSKTDWEGNTTVYTRDVKGRELDRTEASGTPEQRVIRTEWHTTFNLPIKITEPEKETVFSYDGNGNELTRVVTDLP